MEWFGTFEYEHTIVTAWHDSVLRWRWFCALWAHIARADERPCPRL